MNKVKKISRNAVRLVLLVLAPEFLFSQYLRGQMSRYQAAAGASDEIERQRARTETYPNKEIRMSEFVITYRGAVYPWQCDHMGHMNVMWYTGKFDEASWQLLSQLGLTRSRISRDGNGAVALEQRIDYRRELRAGDLITIRSAVLEVNEKTICITHQMTNDETGELAATTVILGLFVDVHLRKSRPMPDDVRERALLMARGQSDLNIDDEVQTVVPTVAAATSDVFAT